MGVRRNSLPFSSRLIESYLSIMWVQSVQGEGGGIVCLSGMKLKEIVASNARW